MLASPIAKPFSQLTPVFIATGLPKKIQTNTVQQNKVLQLQIQLLVTWNIIYRVAGTLCLHANSAKKNKLQSSAKPTQTLKPFHHPCYSTRLPQMHTSPVSGRVPRHVFQARTPSRNSTKYRADDLCGNLICKYFCWMLGDPHSFSADHFLF